MGEVIKKARRAASRSLGIETLLKQACGESLTLKMNCCWKSTSYIIVFVIVRGPVDVQSLEWRCSLTYNNGMARALLS